MSESNLAIYEPLCNATKLLKEREKRRLEELTIFSNFFLQNQIISANYYHLSLTSDKCVVNCKVNSLMNNILIDIRSRSTESEEG